MTDQFSVFGKLFLCLPLLTVILAAIWFSVEQITWVVFQYAQGPVITLALTMFAANVNALVSIQKTMPNLLTLSKVYYSALGYWSLTNICILIVSGYGYSYRYVLPFAWFLIMFCLLNLVSADIIRAFRTAQYQQMEVGATAAAAPPV